MANDYIEQWNINGYVYDIRDKGRGEPNGVATLDNNGRVPYNQLPESALELKGYWDADTNTPTLADGTGTSGDFYFVSVAGSQDLGSGTQYFAVGDRVLYDGSVWKNISSGDVRTINNQAPNAQGNIDLISGTNIPFTKTLLGAIFGRLLGRVWKQGTGNNTSYTMDEFSYANGLWVGASTSHGMWWSADEGKSWTQGTGSNTSYTMVELMYADGLWVCGTYSHGLWWSEDGKSWTQCSGADTYTINVLVYANGLWVCGTTNNGCWWSEDGKSWYQGTGENTTYSISKLMYANGLWVINCANVGMWWSEDGKNWSPGTSVDIVYTNRLYYANGLWISTSTSGIWWSEDGKAWTRSSDFSSTYMSLFVVYVDGLWVCTSSSHGCWWSTDGKSWTQGTGANTTYSMRYLLYANGLWVSTSDANGLWWSADGKSWTQGTSWIGGIPHKPIYKNGLWICPGGTRGMWWSEDGKDWIQGAGANTSDNMDGLTYANGTLMVGSSNHGCWHSSIDDLIEDGTIDLGTVPLIN